MCISLSYDIFSGIIDVIGGRCFVMPLNRDKVLPPRSMGDLIQRLWEGYYNVNTAIVRENMRVVTPPVTDVAEIGQFLSRECEGYPIYKLEKFLGGGMCNVLIQEATEAVLLTEDVHM